MRGKEFAGDISLDDVTFTDGDCDGKMKYKKTKQNKTKNLVYFIKSTASILIMQIFLPDGIT